VIKVAVTCESNRVKYGGSGGVVQIQDQASLVDNDCMCVPSNGSEVDSDFLGD
jgi:hypothetical protein